MTDLSRFTEEEWQVATRRLSASASGYDLESFRQWLGWAETEQRLKERFGEGWTLEQAVDLATIPPKTDYKNLDPSRLTDVERRILERGKNKSRGAGLRPTRPAPGNGAGAGNDDGSGQDTDPQAVVGAEEFKRRVDAKVEEYLNHFTHITPNDLASIQDLARAEVSQAIISELLSKTTNPQTLSRYVYAQKLLSEQTRALQKMLNIDRATRERATRKRSDVDEVLEAIRAAGEWVEREAIAVSHCDTLLGLFASDFREVGWRIEGKCPKCGTTVVVEHTPTEEDLGAIEPDWVEEEEAQYREKETAELAAERMSALSEFQDSEPSEPVE